MGVFVWLTDAFGVACRQTTTPVLQPLLQPPLRRLAQVVQHQAEGRRARLHPEPWEVELLARPPRARTRRRQRCHRRRRAAGSTGARSAGSSRKVTFAPWTSSRPRRERLVVVRSLVSFVRSFGRSFVRRSCGLCSRHTRVSESVSERTHAEPEYRHRRMCSANKQTVGSSTWEVGFGPE